MHGLFETLHLLCYTVTGHWQRYELSGCVWECVCVCLLYTLVLSPGLGSWDTGQGSATLLPDIDEDGRPFLL